MKFRYLIVFALVACILVSEFDAKSIGKHKKHSKKHHVKHQKKAQTPPGAAPDDAGADDAAAGGNDAAAGGGDEPAAGGDAAAGEEEGGAPAPAPAGDDSAEQGMEDNNQDDQLQQQQQNPAPPAPAPEEEDEGSASAQAVNQQQQQPAKIPVLLGGHMRPGPTPETLLPVAARYCDEPCPQTCAPACYDWCCFPSVQAPIPPVQLVMVPVSNSPALPPTPGPLQYPMNYDASAGATCSPQPCSAKKYDVDYTKPAMNTNTLTADNSKNYTLKKSKTENKPDKKHKIRKHGRRHGKE